MTDKKKTSIKKVQRLLKKAKRWKVLRELFDGSNTIEYTIWREYVTGNTDDLLDKFCLLYNIEAPYMEQIVEEYSMKFVEMMEDNNV